MTDDLKRQKAIENYWTERLTGHLPKISLPLMERESAGEMPGRAGWHTAIPEPVSNRLKEISKASDIALFVLFFSGLNLALFKYTGIEDLVVGTITPKQEGKKGQLLLCRNKVSGHLTFKETINQLKQRVLEDFNHSSDYSFGLIYQKVLERSGGNSLEVFNAAGIYDKLQDKGKMLKQFDLVFVLCSRDDRLYLEVDYNAHLYSEGMIARFCRNLVNIFAHINRLLDQKVLEIGILCTEEHQELTAFNNTAVDYPQDKTLHQLFEEQAAKTPDHIALVGAAQRKTPHAPCSMLHAFTYRELNERAGELALRLKEKGVGPGTIVGIMMERSIEMVTGLLAIWKAGGAYLPIGPGTPTNRIVSILDDCGASILFTESGSVDRHSYVMLQGLEATRAVPHLTAPAERIEDFDCLPFPDRSLVDTAKYNRYIGQAVVKNRITIQASRGCPHNCAYCYRIWPRKQVARSGENIFAEIKLYYNMGIRRFDIFMLNLKKGRRLFELIIENHMEDIQLFFPNGFRGDLLTEEYIDLMVKAGTVNFALALETASPRLQKKINKHLDIERFRKNIAYITQKYPHVILELFTMHGIPTETEEEAAMTLDFIKSLKWIHFPYVNVLKIYRRTNMEKLALEAGVSREAILRSENLAWHEWSETLPFDKSFTSRYQADFLNGYVLSRERLLHILPYQIKLLTEAEFVDKYDSYLPADIKSFDDFLAFTGLDREVLGECCFRDEEEDEVVLSGLNEKIREHFPVHTPAGDALRVLLLDLSQFFSDDGDMLYDVVDPPLGLMYLLTYLHEQLGNKINGRILKPRIDFDSHEELKAILEEFRPQLIGIRSLSYYRDFFHKTVSLIRQWGVDVPIIAGGPYATVDYQNLLQDGNIDLAVLGEGEITFCLFVEEIIKNSGALPGREVLEQIPGIAFMPEGNHFAREILLSEDSLYKKFFRGPGGGFSKKPPGRRRQNLTRPDDPAYIIFTSGSTGKPKGVMVEHRQMVNVLRWFAGAYGLQPGTYVLQLTNYTFDPSIEQIFAALLHGAAVYLPGKEAVVDRDIFTRLVEKHHIHIINHIPGVLSQLLSGEKRLASLRAVISGGEKLDNPVKNRLIGKGYPLYNQYGPTETTIDALMKKCSLEGPVTLGSPIANVQCHIMDKHMNPVPIGVVGELYIGGAGVARGYLNRPELTAEKFVISHLSLVNGQSLILPMTNDQCPMTSYRTGDLARWLLCGEIEFLGRMDQQIKLRGLRIELGEIESQLVTFRGVKEAVVIQRESPRGDKYLCAYIISQHNPGPSPVQLREYLTMELPDYMIPASFVILDVLPRTPNGKLDRGALPDPDETGTDSSVEYAPPTNEVEEKLVEVWEGVLGREPIGIHENFFMIGGDSVKSIQIISRLKNAGYRLELKKLFDFPSVAQLAPLVEKAAALPVMPAPARGPAAQRDYHKLLKGTAIEGEVEDLYPLTPLQEGMLISALRDDTSTAYFEQMSYRLRGPFDPAAVEKSLNELLKRHNILRTVFIHQGFERPMQVILKERRVDFCYIPLDQVKGDVETFIKEFKEKDRRRLFDLGKDVLMRVTLIQADETVYELTWSHHHILMDGWCATILVSEFFEIYTALLKNRPFGLQELKPYKNYIEWLEQRDKEESKNYWQHYLANYGECASLPVIGSLPATALTTYKNEHFFITLSIEETKGLKHLAVGSQVTLNTVFQALWGIFLGRYIGRCDVVFGSVVSGRPPEVEGVETMVGLFINTVPTRIRFSEETCFNDFLQQVQRSALESEPHHYYPLADIQSHSQLKQDLLDHILVFENVPIGRDIEDILIPGNRKDNETDDTVRFELLNYDVFEQTNYPFNLVIYPGDSITVKFQYDGNVYETSWVQRMAGHLKNALQQVLETDNLLIRQVSLLAPAEKKQLLVDFNNSQSPYPESKTLEQLFEEQALKTPTNKAVTAPPTSMTYGELNEKANRLAHTLRKKGIGPDQVVALLLERSPEMVVGIMAVLKAGGAYLPMDVQYPEARIAYMLEDSGAGVLLTQSTTRHRAAKVGKTSRVEVLDLASPQVYQDPAANPVLVNHPRHLVHILYTSGSTGRPRGVMLQHRSVVNFIYDLHEHYYKKYKDPPLKIAMVAPYIFAGSVKQLFSALLFGHSLYIVPEEGRFNGSLLIDFFNRYDIHISDGAPAHLKMMVKAYAHREDKHCAVRHFNISADTLPAALVEEFLAVVAGDKPDIANFYGPTECCIDSSGCIIDPQALKKGHPVPIGTPLANTVIHLLDHRKMLTPIGVFGEVYIGGDGLARGYMNNPELTNSKFQRGWHPQPIRNYKAPAGHPLSFPASQLLSFSLYRTGDRGRWLPDGSLEFAGRSDRQLNIRGFRIEPGEIENTLLQHPGIEDSVVTAAEKDGEFQLTAYITPVKKILLRPSWAEQFAYDDMAYHAMSSDEFRNEKYKAVFNRRLKDKTVLEIGPGPEAILSRFCIEAGARKVYAVEIFEDAYKKAKQVIESSGLGDKIILIHGDVTRVKLPEKVDYCVSEIVGSIGGSQGSAGIINRARKLLKTPGCMIPSRSLSKIAAVTLPPEVFHYTFDQVGAHYTNKIFENAGYKFDLRLCLANFDTQYIISGTGTFEDLDYTRENPLEAEQAFCLEIQQDAVLNGFIVWLELYIDPETIINTLAAGKLWLPMYLPVFSGGVKVKKGDRVEARVTRKLSHNNVNPDYSVSGFLQRRDSTPETFHYNWFNQEPLYKQNQFYRKVFDHDKPRVEEEVTPAGIRDFLSALLPPYMIPTAVVLLDRVPLTASGKIDYQALPGLRKGKSGKTAAYIPPANESEEAIIHVWSDVLEINAEEISVEDDFFDLGGNSITILNVLARLKKHFNQDIPFGSLFLHPTVRSLAANIREQGLLDRLECIVRLNRGQTGKNLFIIHPMHGMVYQYKDLAVLLEDCYDVYGIQARGLVRNSPLAETMDIMVVDYIRQIRAVQPEGPYLIAAHCFGDILAYNLVKEMENLNLEVERLIMFDEPAWISFIEAWHYKRKELLRSIGNIVTYPAKKIKKMLGRHTPTPYEKRVKEIEHLESRSREAAVLSPEQMLQRKVKVHINIERLDREYWHTHPYRRLKGIIRAPLLIVKAEERQNRRFDMKKLRHMTYSKDIKLVESPGTHDTLFDEENVTTLGRVLKKALGHQDY